MLFASCRQSVRDGGTGDPPWHRNQHARSPLMLGTKRKRLTRKYGPSWWRCNSSERTWGSRMLLGSANLNGTLPASSICLVRSALFPDGFMRISLSCSLGVHQVRSWSFQIGFPLASVLPEEVCHEHMLPPRIRDTLIVQLFLRGTCDHRIFHFLFTHVHLSIPA